MLIFTIVLLAVFFRVYRLDEFPPALYWDEAFDALDALRVVRTTVHPIFFDGNFGREPLTIYLQAVGIFLMGAREWVVRVVPAMIGIATIPVLYRVGTLLYAGEERAKNIGVLAAGMLAVSFWHIQLSRTSLRVITFPLLNTITVWFFWRAWQNRRMLSFALCGIALGLTLYTYTSARLIPIIFIVFVVAVGLLSFVSPTYFPRTSLPRVAIGLVMLIAVMLIVFVPLGIYFVEHPGEFFLRASYVSIFSSGATGIVNLGRNVVATARMFIDRGDPTPYYNLPGRPAFDLVTAVAFWIGLTIALVRFRSRPVYLLLLVWLGVCLIPTILSDQAPHFLRASGALPPALLMAADGLTWLHGRLVPKPDFSIVMIGVLAFGGALTFNDYFNVWGPSKLVYNEFEVSKRTILQRVASLSNTTDVVLPFTLYVSPQAEFYLGSRFVTPEPYEGVSNARPVMWVTTGGNERTVAILQKDGRAMVPDPLNDEQTGRLDELMTNSQPLKNPFGQTIASQLQVSDASGLLSELKPTRPIDIDFGGQLKMWGYDLTPRRVAPGDKVRVTYYWQALVDEAFDYKVQSVLLNANMNVFGRQFTLQGKTPTNFWQRGTIVLDSFELQVPTTAHAGQYRFEVKVVSPASPDSPLPISASEDRLLLDPFTIAPQAVNADTVAHPLGIGLGDPPFITLLGYNIERATMQRGEPLRITFYWKSERSTPVDYSVFLHLLAANGRILAQQDGPPQNGDAPTSWWVPGDIIADTHEVVIPETARDGHYNLAIGVYNSADDIRLPLFDVSGKQQPNDFIQLPVEIAGP